MSSPPSKPQDLTPFSSSSMTHSSMTSKSFTSRTFIRSSPLLPHLSSPIIMTHVRLPMPRSSFVILSSKRLRLVSHSLGLMLFLISGLLDRIMVSKILTKWTKGISPGWLNLWRSSLNQGLSLLWVRSIVHRCFRRSRWCSPLLRG